MNKKIKQLRIEKGFTQKQVADAIGIVPTAITNYESGIREPSLDTLKKLCILFGVSADYLLGLEDETGAKNYIANSFNNNSGNINFKG